MSKAKKEFGQHFLSNAGVIDKIVRALQKLDCRPPELVVEIGPGKGALTEQLLEQGYQVHAFEIDEDMVNELKGRFSSEIAAGKLKISQQDFMRVTRNDLRGAKAVVGNLPYNVGSQIVFRCLEEFLDCSRFVFMLQKEVIDKFLGTPEKPKSYGPPSIKFSLVASLSERFNVSPGSFSPPPKVMSAVFAFERKKKAMISPTDPNWTQLSELLTTSFNQRRKKLRNTATSWSLGEFAEKRPEELSPQDFAAIASGLKSD